MSWVRSGWSQASARMPFLDTSNSSSLEKRLVLLYDALTLPKHTVSWIWIMILKPFHMVVPSSILSGFCVINHKILVISAKCQMGWKQWSDPVVCVCVSVSVCTSPHSGCKHRREDVEEGWGLCCQSAHHNGSGRRAPCAECPEVRPHHNLDDSAQT